MKLLRNLFDYFILQGKILLPVRLWQKIIIWGCLPFIAIVWFLGGQKILGLGGFAILTIVIYTKPAVLLFPTFGIFKTLLALRRQLGNLSALFIFAHVLSQVVPGFGLIDNLKYAASSGFSNFYFWGLIGLILIIPLFITSNNFFTRTLKRNWFRLHKLIHPLYWAALLHFALQKNLTGQLLSLFLFIFLYLSRFLASRGLKFFAAKPVVPVI